jgi:two-component system, sensor histidine kinase and response regulator
MIPAKQAVRIGLGASLVLIVFTSFSSYQSAERYHRDAKWVSHTREVILTLQRINIFHQKIRASARGYVITRGKEDLTTYQESKQAFQFQMEQLRVLVADNISQKQRVTHIERLLPERWSYLDQLIVLGRIRDIQAAERLIESRPHLAVRDALYDYLDTMEQEERLLLQKRLDARQRSHARAKVWVISGAALSIFLFCWVAFMLRRENRQRENVERQIKEQKAVLESVVDNLAEGLVVADTRGEFLIFNPAAVHILGIGQVQSSPQEWTDRYGMFETDQKTPLATEDLPLIKAINGEACDNKELFVRNPKIPEGAFISVSGRPIRDENGRLQGGVVVFHDISERRKAQQTMAEARDTAMESARLKSEFMANMSHEIRTPMNAIIGMASLLLDTRLDTKQRQFAQIVMRAGESLLSIINDILDFSKIESGKFILESTDVDMRAIVEDVLLMLAEKAQAKNVELISSIPNALPPLVWGDPHRLRQVLTNLVGNAVKFTEKGEVVIRVSEEYRDQDRHWIRFQVEDTGIGIPEEARGKLFNAFTQADGSTTRKFGGTGLGLAISKKLVELMGGEMGAQSEPGKGSVFWFTAPFKTHEGKPAILEPQRELAGQRVLIVDDNKTNREIVHHQIVSWGMKNGDASSGIEALEILRREASAGQPYNLAILDMQMPEMDGLSLAQVIKSDPLIASTRLIIMTSLGNQMEPRMLRNAGVERCLIKPVRQSDLYNCLVAVLTAGVSTSNPKKRIKKPRPSSRSAPVHAARLLIVEDNKVNQEVTLFQLEKLGYQADVAANGHEAIEAHARHAYDVILMDCQMPEMDGYAATAEIRRRETGGRRTPIIAMTANALEGDRQRCLNAGMDDYISKPVSLSVLKTMLEHVLETSAPVAGAAGAASPEKGSTVVEVINMKYLREVTDHDETGMRRLVGIYLQETARELQNLEAALKAGQTEEVHRIAHGCKGASAAYGMTLIAAILKEIEFQGRDKRLEETPAALLRAQAAFRDIESFWKSYLEGTSGAKAA